MVSNVKNCLLLVRIVLLLVFVVSSSARFSTKLTTSEINSICTDSAIDDASSCFELLKSAPNIAALDPSGLVKYLINYDSRKISDMLKQFQSLVRSTTDPSAKGSYDVCVGTFDKAIDCSEEAPTYLASKDYITLVFRVGCTDDMASQCQDELSTFKPNPQLVKDVSIVRNLASIILVIVRKFLKK